MLSLKHLVMIMTCENSNVSIAAWESVVQDEMALEHLEGILYNVGGLSNIDTTVKLFVLQHSFWQKIGTIA